MPHLSPHNLIARHGLVSDQVDARELALILSELAGVLATTGGAVVEFGCYSGTTSLYIQRLIDAYKDKNNVKNSGNSHEFHVYDSFAGLPEKSVQDSSPAGEQFKTGELAASKKQFMMNFKKAGLRLPVIHKAWFDQLTPADVPDDIAFAFLDGDYYDSITDSLKLIWPKLIDGAIVVVDDYMNEALPGAARAIDDWLQTHPATLRRQYSLAIISS